MQIIEKIISNFSNNNSLYIGEKLTMSEHMIQSAMLAEKSKKEVKEVEAKQEVHEVHERIDKNFRTVSQIRRP